MLGRHLSRALQATLSSGPNAVFRLDSIERLAIGVEGSGLIERCPNLRVAVGIFYRGRMFGSLERERAEDMLSNIISRCPKIEEITGFPIVWKKHING
jgi:hypothetical protein